MSIDCRAFKVVIMIEASFSCRCIDHIRLENIGPADVESYPAKNFK